jgi:hypothetical protein
VDSTVKNLAKATANKHFDGNMSDMFRYSLYHCDFSGDGDITRKVADALEDIRKALNANRTVNANIWKRVREHFTTKQ